MSGRSTLSRKNYYNSRIIFAMNRYSNNFIVKLTGYKKGILYLNPLCNQQNSWWNGSKWLSCIAIYLVPGRIHLPSIGILAGKLEDQMRRVDGRVTIGILL